MVSRMDNYERNRTERATLYLVATPIGNLADVSERAKKVLSEVDFIAAEDTRNTAKLLGCLGIRGELVSYHEHNKRESGEKIIARLLTGESCALVTDAGMPAISDPGEDLVRECHAAGVHVTAVPGCSAVVTALALSGLCTSRFTFEGFLPAKSGEKKKILSYLAKEERTMIFYEAPHKLRATLDAMAETFGNARCATLCRELTKINEEIRTGTLGEHVTHFASCEPRGEFVIVVDGAEPQRGGPEELLSLSPVEHVAHYESTGMPRMDAIKAAAKDRGISKSDMYKLVI